jgi:hypothetical protein
MQEEGEDSGDDVERLESFSISCSFSTFLLAFDLLLAFRSEYFDVEL